MGILSQILEQLQAISYKHIIMWAIGALLIYLAIKKDMEPALLLPMGFGAILVNLPFSGALTQGTEIGALSKLFDIGIGEESGELFPLLLFIGIGAMIDFGPLLSNPKLLLFGAAAQFGIFFTLSMARLFGFELNDAASIAIIGAADGPTSIVVAKLLKSQFIGAIMVAAYSYMALVPIIQPPVIKLLTTKKERLIRMPYEAKNVSKLTRILFPDNAHGNRRHHSAEERFAHRIPHVRQSAPRMWRARFTLGNSAKGSCKSHHAPARHHHSNTDAGR